MADYISREAAVAAMTALRQEDIEAFGMVIPECFPSTSAIEALNKIPAADVRPVIKCKNCRWWTKQEKSLQGRCELGGFYPTGEWFCANGERPNCGADMREVTTDG